MVKTKPSGIVRLSLGSYHVAVAVRSGKALDGAADFVQLLAGLHGSNPGPHRPTTITTEALDASAGRRDGKARTGVAEIAIQLSRDVDIDQIARLHHRAVRDAMRAVGAYRNASRARKTVGEFG
jgi:hypothetical protein